MDNYTVLYLGERLRKKANIAEWARSVAKWMGEHPAFVRSAIGGTTSAGLSINQAHNLGLSPSEALPSVAFSTALGTTAGGLTTHSNPMVRKGIAPAAGIGALGMDFFGAPIQALAQRGSRILGGNEELQKQEAQINQQAIEKGKLENQALSHPAQPSKPAPLPPTPGLQERVTDWVGKNPGTAAAVGGGAVLLPFVAKALWEFSRAANRMGEGHVFRFSASLRKHKGQPTDINIGEGPITKPVESQHTGGLHPERKEPEAEPEKKEAAFPFGAMLSLPIIMGSRAYEQRKQPEVPAPEPASLPAAAAAGLVPFAGPAFYGAHVNHRNQTGSHDPKSPDARSRLAILAGLGGLGGGLGAMSLVKPEASSLALVGTVLGGIAAGQAIGSTAGAAWYNKDLGKYNHKNKKESK